MLKLIIENNKKYIVNDTSKHAFDVIKGGKVIFSNFSYNEACKLSDKFGGLVSKKIEENKI